MVQSGLVRAAKLAGELRRLADLFAPRGSIATTGKAAIQIGSNIIQLPRPLPPDPKAKPMLARLSDRPPPEESPLVVALILRFAADYIERADAISQANRAMKYVSIQDDSNRRRDGNRCPAMSLAEMD